MNDTLNAIMEPVQVQGTITGTGIIDDLLFRLGEKLSRSCDLRATDAYKSYSAKVVVELQLQDVDRVEALNERAVGVIDRARLVERITLSSADASPVMTQDASLERPVDPAGVQEAPAKQTRQYVSRIRQPRF